MKRWHESKGHKKSLTCLTLYNIMHMSENLPFICSYVGHHNYPILLQYTSWITNNAIFNMQHFTKWLIPIHQLVIIKNQPRANTGQHLKARGHPKVMLQTWWNMSHCINPVVPLTYYVEWVCACLPPNMKHVFSPRVDAEEGPLLWWIWDHPTLRKPTYWYHHWVSITYLQDPLGPNKTQLLVSSLPAWLLAFHSYLHAAISIHKLFELSTSQQGLKPQGKPRRHIQCQGQFLIHLLPIDQSGQEHQHLQGCEVLEHQHGTPLTTQLHKFPPSFGKRKNGLSAAFFAYFNGVTKMHLHAQHCQFVFGHREILCPSCKSLTPNVFPWCTDTRTAFVEDMFRWKSFDVDTWQVATVTNV